MQSFNIKALILVSTFSASIAFAAPPSSHQISLIDAYMAAINNTETYKISKAETVQAKERLRQITSYALPRVSAVGTYKYAEKPDPNAQVSDSFTEESKAARMVASQSLFKGFQDLHVRSSQVSQVKASEQNENFTKIQVFSEVAEIFFNVISLESDLKSLKSLEDLTVKRVNELRSRVKTGRSRDGELINARAQLAVLYSQIKNAERLLEQAWDLFYFRTKLPKATLVSNVSLPEKIENVDYYLEKGKSRPDIKSLEALAESSRSLVKGAQSAHLPSLDFLGNYYLKREREREIEGSDWDIALNLTIPLFEGGETQAKVREAKAFQTESELRLAQTRRQVESEIRSYHHAVETGLSQIKALEESYTLARQNFEQQNRDYRLGLVNNLDVLQALDTLRESQRAWNLMRYETLVQFSKLEASIGKLPSEIKGKGS